MDPNATLAAWREAREENDLEAAREHKLNLVVWLESGGFWPTEIQGWEVEILEKIGAPKKPLA